MSTEKIGIKGGDVVRLKSGGPAMTVVKPSEGNCFECAWFTEYDTASSVEEPRPQRWNNFPNFADFPAWALVLVDL